MHDVTTGPGLALLALCIPATYGFAALLVSRAAPFRSALVATWTGGLLACFVVAAHAFRPSQLATGAPPGPLQQAVGHAVRIDLVTCVVLALVCALAVVLVRYSRTYLDGEPRRPRYARALLATLASVTLLVVSNNLGVIALAWFGTSLALHRLLTYYGDRPRALVAAHKKFLLSRTADACWLLALLLVGQAVGSLDLDRVNAFASERGHLEPALQIAAVLLVLAVVLRSAQLPFHGWLIQVMEAPTPVSALLHAGVVNIGGFLMIRLAPFMAHAAVAQTLLVAIGTVSAVVAALVMATRVSVKVALAWSTCAQMGLMLVQCGLGAWHLALLHLVAHSLYKAHAFLTSGSVVEAWRVQEISPRRPSPRAFHYLAAAALALVLTGSAVLLTHPAGSDLADPSWAPFAAILWTALVPLLARGLSAGRRSMAGIGLWSIGVVALYFGWHAACTRWLAPQPAALAPASILVTVAFVLLLGVQVVLQARPHGRFARALHPHLFAGLYLDEFFTRMTFRLWPPRLGERSAATARLQPEILPETTR